jgi:hypothetical protein
VLGTKLETLLDFRMGSLRVIWMEISTVIVGLFVGDSEGLDVGDVGLDVGDVVGGDVTSGGIGGQAPMQTAVQVPPWEGEPPTQENAATVILKPGGRLPVAEAVAV